MTRASYHIRRKAASNLHHAIRIADALGQPLNTFVTINFSETACPPDQASQAFSRLRNNRFSHWARRPPRNSKIKGYSPAFVWVIEGAGGVTAAHWLLHVPSQRLSDFRARIPQWVEGAAGEILSSSAIDVRPAPYPKGLGRYMLKGTEEVYASFYGVNFEDQGLVHGKRSGFSQNLGPTAKRQLRSEGRYPQARRFRPYPASPTTAAQAARS